MVYNILFGVACALFVAIAILQLVLIFNIKEQWNKFLGVNLSVYLIWLALFFIGPIIGGSDPSSFLGEVGKAYRIMVFIIYFYIPLVVLSVVLLIAGIVIKIENSILSNKKLIFKSFATSLVSTLLILLFATLIAQLF